MSYCRWSTNDFQCDLYCYEHCGGYWTVHVAANRVQYKGPLPMYVPLETGRLDEYFTRHRIVMNMLDMADRVDIDLPYAGETINCATLDEFLTTLYMLRDLGYVFPDYVLDAVREEIKEEANGTNSVPLLQ